jgi:zinc transport system ATP-binding protein
MEPVIEVRDLSFSYNGEEVLRDVNLKIAEGDFAWVVGPNGGGKTTLLKLVLGLIKPVRGTLRVMGKSPHRSRGKIGYVPQRTNLDSRFPATVLDVAMMGRLGLGRTLGGYSRDDRREACAALKEVGLAEMSARPFGQLSGGQQQRLFIARALASEPRMLLLDEPAANLDPRVERGLYDLLVRLNERLTIVLVSHNVSLVSEFVEEVVCVNRTVAVHPTLELDTEMLGDLHAGPLRMVRHDRHVEGGSDRDRIL